MNTKGGQDHVMIERVTISGDVAINTGGASDFVNLSDDTQIGGNPSINSGGGNDQVNLGLFGPLLVQGQTNASLAGGKDIIGISDFHGVGAIRIDGGGGFDRLDDFGGNIFDLTPVFIKIEEFVNVV